MAEADGPALDSASLEFHPQTKLDKSLPERALNSVDLNPSFTSISDSGLSKRPRDARLVHLILANYGATAYQERIPLQLMDFSYRYTANILQDALHFTSEGYGTVSSGTKSAGSIEDKNPVTQAALRLSIHSRTHYQFNPTLSKEVYSDIAQDKNRIALPPVQREWGMRLPPEQYCLTGIGFDIKDEWQEEDDMEVLANSASDEVTTRNGGPAEGDDGEGEDIEGGGRMEDIFGEEATTSDGGKMEE